MKRKIIFLTLLLFPGIWTLAQTNYFGPSKPIPGNPQLIRVEVLAYDDADPAGLHIIEVIFNGQRLPLQPRDLIGYRGGGSFQVRPGKYLLSWEVSPNQRNWPREVSHQQTIDVSPRDLWIQIKIQGDEVTLS